MPKALVTRWRRKRPVYMSPIKRPETIKETYILNELVDIIESVTQTNYVQDIVSQTFKDHVKTIYQINRLSKTSWL